jgi:hypothetical protein
VDRGAARPRTAARPRVCAAEAQAGPFLPNGQPRSKERETGGRGGRWAGDDFHVRQAPSHAKKRASQPGRWFAGRHSAHHRPGWTPLSNTAHSPSALRHRALSPTPLRVTPYPMQELCQLFPRVMSPHLRRFGAPTQWSRTRPGSHSLHLVHHRSRSHGRGALGANAALIPAMIDKVRAGSGAAKGPIAGRHRRRRRLGQVSVVQPLLEWPLQGRQQALEGREVTVV